MKSLSRKLFISMLAMVLMFITLGTTTFAWITLSNTASITGMDAKVKGVDGLEFSTDGVTWVSALDLEVKDFEFTPVTTNDGVTFKKGAIDNDGKYKTTTDTEANDYYSTTIYVRVTAQSEYYDTTEIQLDSLFAKCASANEWTADVDFSGATGMTAPTSNTYSTISQNPYLFDPANALRMSFVPYSFNDNYKEVEGTKSTGGSIKFNQLMGAFAIADKGTAATSKLNVAIENKSSNGYAVGYHGTTVGIAQAYLTAKGISLSTSDHVEPLTGDDIIIADRTSEDADGTTASVNENILDNNNLFRSSDGKYYYAAFQFNLWLEGWDADCLNALLNSDTVTISLNFSSNFVAYTSGTVTIEEEE